MSAAWMAVGAAYFVVGLFVARWAGWRRFAKLEARLAEYGGGEWFQGGEDSYGHVKTSPWDYPQLYLVPFFTGVLWLPLAVLHVVAAVLGCAGWIIGRFYIRVLHPPIAWFFTDPKRRSGVEQLGDVA